MHPKSSKKIDKSIEKKLKRGKIRVYHNYYESDSSVIMNVEGIRNKIKRLYEAGCDIHVSINTVRPRINVENSSAEIKGVYV